jgi:hypothetical protein
MVIAVNELSFSAGSDTPDHELLRQFGATLIVLRDALPRHRRNEISFRAPDILGPSPCLPGGQSVSKALEKVKNDDERTLLLILLDFPGLTCEIPARFQFQNEPAHGLGHALEDNGLTISLASTVWCVDQVALISLDPDVLSGVVPNAWRNELAGAHREALGRHIPVLPGYHDPGTHDPGSQHYDSRKSRIPLRAQWILSHALLHRGVWWARCEHEFFHRFGGGDPVHWNGTTDPDAIQPTSIEDVPAAVREFWKRQAVEDCGCR